MHESWCAISSHRLLYLHSTTTLKAPLRRTRPWVYRCTGRFLPDSNALLHTFDALADSGVLRTDGQWSHSRSYLQVLSFCVASKLPASQYYHTGPHNLGESQITPLAWEQARTHHGHRRRSDTRRTRAIGPATGGTSSPGFMGYCVPWLSYVSITNCLDSVPCFNAPQSLPFAAPARGLPQFVVIQRP